MATQLCVQMQTNCVHMFPLQWLFAGSSELFFVWAALSFCLQRILHLDKFSSSIWNIHFLCFRGYTSSQLLALPLESISKQFDKRAIAIGCVRQSRVRRMHPLARDFPRRPVNAACIPQMKMLHGRKLIRV